MVRLSRWIALSILSLAGITACSNSHPEEAHENESVAEQTSQTALKATDSDTSQGESASDTTNQDLEDAETTTRDATTEEDSDDATAHDGSQCATGTPVEVLNAYVAANPVSTQGYEWGPSWAENHWEPCADLSWITLPIDRGTASSPYRIALFHDGEPIGRATFEDYGFHPTVVRLDDTTIRVTYTYALDGEATATASGRAVSTFTWIDDQDKVVHSGEVPPSP